MWHTFGLPPCVIRFLLCLENTFAQYLEEKRKDSLGLQINQNLKVTHLQTMKAIIYFSNSLHSKT